MSGVEALGFLVAEFLFASCCLERSDLGAWGGGDFFHSLHNRERFGTTKKGFDQHILVWQPGNPQEKVAMLRFVYAITTPRILRFPPPNCASLAKVRSAPPLRIRLAIISKLGYIFTAGERCSGQGPGNKLIWKKMCVGLGFLLPRFFGWGKEKERKKATTNTIGRSSK